MSIPSALALNALTRTSSLLHQLPCLEGSTHTLRRTAFMPMDFIRAVHSRSFPCQSKSFSPFCSCSVAQLMSAPIAKSCAARGMQREHRSEMMICLIVCGGYCFYGLCHSLRHSIVEKKVCGGYCFYGLCHSLRHSIIKKMVCGGCCS